MHKPFLVIAGNIGSGKTTLAAKLGEELGIALVAEPASSNPYLEDFYEDMASHAYHSQLFFLASALHEHRQIEARGGGAVLDRSIYEHYLVFAQQLHLDGQISDADFSVLSDLYYGVQDLLPPPHLVVMLEASTDQLYKRIVSRGGADKSISVEYLESLQVRYREFSDGWVACPLLKVDTEQVVSRTPQGLEELAGMVLASLPA